MSQSYISNVSFHEQRFIGQSAIYDSSVVNIASVPFTYSMNIPSSLPNPETSVSDITVTGVSGSDSNGTIYSGQFRIKRNSSTNNPAIIVTGVGLTASQVNLIKSSVSIVESPPSGGFDDLATVAVSLFPIARAGIRNFDITIPFEDSHISIPTNTIQIPFLNFDGSRAASFFVNPISVSVDNGELSINAGDLPQTLPAIRFARNWPSSRTMNYVYISYDSGQQTRYLNLQVNESLSNANAIKFVPQNIPVLPSSDSTGFTTDMNYNVQISTQLWKTVPTTAGAGTYYQNNANYRLYYIIKYGIGRISGSTFTSGDFLQYTPYFGSNSYEYVDRAGTADNPIMTMSWECNDSSPPNRNVFSVTNHNGSLADIELSIDRFDYSNNVFRIHSTLNNADFTFTYQGFSGDMYAEDFIANVKAEMASQCPAWVSPPSPQPGRFAFALDTLFRYAKMKDFPSTSVDNIPNDSRAIFDVFPEHRGSSSFQFSLTVYDASSNTNITVGQLLAFLKETFGSYGLSLDKYIPNTTEWMSLNVFPTILPNYSVSYVFNSGPSTSPRVFSSNTSAFLDLTCASTHKDQYHPASVSTGQHIATVSVTTTGTEVSEMASAMQTTINNAISSSYFRKAFVPTNARNLTISCEYPSYYGEINISRLKTVSGGSVLTAFPSYTVGAITYTAYVNRPSTLSLSTGQSINSSFSSLKFTTGQTNYTEYNIPIAPLDIFESLVNDVNDPSQPWSAIVSATLLDASFFQVTLSNLSSIQSWDLADPAYGDLNVNATIIESYIRRYRLDQHSTLQSLVSAIQLDFSSNIDVSVNSATNNHSGVTPSSLVSPALIPNIKTSPLPKTLLGTVYSTPTPITPTYDVKLSYTVGFASTSGGSQPKVNGLQVAIGGYEKGGVFYPYNAPNSFFEPVYNTKFPISFTTIDADIVYLLLRTRESTQNGPTTYSSNYNCYSGLVQYSNGYNPYSLVPFIPGETKFTSVWSENTVGVPTVVAVPVYSTVMDVSLEDNCIFDSVSVQIINKPSAIDDFGFLAINRTNNNKSQTESRTGKTFGLVLDNRGSWDVMISPEAIMHLDSSGSVSYLGSFYRREILGDDEGYDFSITTSLPDAVKNSISISPVPGNPQVWVLRVEHGVKKYLGSLVSARDDEESLDGCSLDIDLLIRGRTTGVEGTARVTIYYDYTCVYDIGLCDFFWNLIDPPKPTGPEIIQNRLEFAYETLVDCSNLTTPIGNNIAVNAPILLTITNIPTFVNGNALLLVKSSYTPEVQGFYFPVGNQLDVLQFSTCSGINSNLPLMQRLNREFLLLPNNPTPVTDSFQIQEMLQTEESYLYVKPQFSFPPDDNIKDCNNNEIVIVGIGYVFKNWINGTRQDDIVFGTHLLFPQDLYASPEINLCYRYYYNQKKT
jgi:hypothetical protein